MKSVMASVAIAGLFLTGCALEKQQSNILDQDSANYAGFQIMSSSDMNRYKAAMPKFAWSHLNDIIDHSNTMWYSKKEIIGAYQDSVGDGPTAPIGGRRNQDGARLINPIPGGRKLFSQDGKTWAFPFAHTAGTDNSHNVEIANFIHLPTVNGQKQPVVYWEHHNARALGGLGLHKWHWMYPKGAILGEMIYLKTGVGELLPLELRTRTRYTTGWATNVYRPFPKATTLAKSIKSLRPNWQESSNLKRMVEHLEDSSTLSSDSQSSTAFPGTFSAEGAKDTIPAFGDAALVQDLLTKTPFASMYGQTWKKNGSLVAYAPTTSEAMSVVPQNYHAGLIEVNEKSCMKCHQDAGRPVRNFNDNAILYGDIWGEDGIFSFHPWQSNIIRGTDENRRLRSDFVENKIIAKYSESTHGAEIYKKLPTTYDPHR